MLQEAKMSSVPPLPVPSEAPTLAEIEHNMMARESQKPRVLTAAELERQLRGEPPLPTEHSKPQMSVPAPIPPVGAAVAFRNKVDVLFLIQTYFRSKNSELSMVNGCCF